MDDDGWVTVNRKFTDKENKWMEREAKDQNRKFTQTITEERVNKWPEREGKDYVKDSIEADNILREERRRKNILKKQRIKEEKKYKREQLARELQESKRRDTKVQVISQAVIDLNNKNVRNRQANKTFVPQNPPNTYNPLSNYSADYPTLQVINLHDRNKPQTKSVNREKTLISSYNSSINESTGIKLPSPPSLQSSASPQKFTSIKDKSSMHKGPETSVLEIIPPKRKVKTKDRINLEIMDLIELKKKSEAQKAKPHHHTTTPVSPEKIERRGKISEGKKKLTTLKKNQLRQKKQKTDLLSVLNEISLKNENLIKLEDALQEDKNKNDIQRTESSNEKNSSSIKNDENKCTHTSNEASDEPPCLTEDSKLKAQQDLLNDIRSLMNPIHSRKFREYCTHVLSPDIDQVLKELIELVVMFHQRLYHQDPTKAKMRRRFYCGLKEALKHMNKVTCLVMAPNLKPSPGPGCLDELVKKVLASASEHGVPVIFGLTDRVLGRLSHRKVPSSCLSLVNIQGAQEKFEKVKELVTKATQQYEDLIKKYAGNNSGENQIKSPTKDGS